MDKLNSLVKEFLKQHKENEEVLKELEQENRELINKQEEKVRETAVKLLPVMELIASGRYRFKGKGTEYLSLRGPILKHDTRENLLYIFSVQQKHPVTVNLYNEEVKNTTYPRLLEEVEFSQVMESLLMVLDFNDYIKSLYNDGNNALKTELKRFENI